MFLVKIKEGDFLHANGNNIQVTKCHMEPNAGLIVTGILVDGERKGNLATLRFTTSRVVTEESCAGLADLLGKVVT